MRTLYRVPTYLYEHDLGWLFGRRFLCLTHVGRRSGRRYRTVIEVAELAGDEFMVISGFGRKSDWFRNVLAGGEISVTVGRRQFVAAARELDEAEAVGVLARYERKYRWVAPAARYVLGHFAGWRYDGSADARRRLAAELPIIAFRPKGS